MATFKLIEAEIRTVPQGKNNAGKKYLIGKLKNNACFWEEARTYTNFDDAVVNAFMQLLPIAKGGTAQQEQPLPPEMTTVCGKWVDYVPPQKFYKIHLSNHPAGTRMVNGQTVQTPEIHAGDLVKAGGIPTVFTTLRVFCQTYRDDETNEIVYRAGCSPAEIGGRAFQAYCIPIAEDNSPQQVNESTMQQQNGGVVPTQPQTVQQPVQQAAPMQGQQTTQQAMQGQSQQPTYNQNMMETGMLQENQLVYRKVDWLFYLSITQQFKQKLY